MAFIQKIPQAQFVHVPTPGSKVRATVHGEQLVCDYRGGVQILGRLPKDRRYKLWNNKLKNGFAWVDAAASNWSTRPRRRPNSPRASAARPADFYGMAGRLFFVFLPLLTPPWRRALRQILQRRRRRGSGGGTPSPPRRGRTTATARLGRG